MRDFLPISARVRRLSVASGLAVRARRLFWQGRADSWDQQGSQALTKVFAAVLEACQTNAATVAVDLGCGSGQVTLPLAKRCATILGVDVSSDMIGLLKEKAQAEQRDNLQLMVGSIESLDLDAESVDLVVSNYALHHLRDADKKAVLTRAFAWLRPGGQLVIGDMMFGRGSSPRDRQVIAAKVHAMARRGPAGWWRILKNVWRFSLRTSEKPISSDGWEALVAEAGFTQIRTRLVVQEACVLSAFTPPAA